MAADPAPQLLRHPDGACPDRIAPEERLDVLRQFQGAAVALVGFLPEACQADGLQVPRDVRLEAGHGDRLVVEHLQDGVQRRLPPEGGAAGQQLVEDGPQGVDVRGRAHRLARDHRLFGGHVIGRAEDLSRGGRALKTGRLPVAVGALGHAEVGDLRRDG